MRSKENSFNSVKKLLDIKSISSYEQKRQFPYMQ